MGKNNNEKNTNETEQEQASQVDTQESVYSGPVKDCEACKATGLNREDLTKLCAVCNGSGLVPDESEPDNESEETDR